MAASIRKMISAKAKRCLGVRVASHLFGPKTSRSSTRYIWTLTANQRCGPKYGMATKKRLMSVSWSQPQQQQPLYNESRLSVQVIHSRGLKMTSGPISTFCCGKPAGTTSPRNVVSFYGCQARNFSSDRDGRDEAPKPSGRRQMKLMDFQEIIWPSPLKSLRNQFFSLLIKSYLDRTFSLPGFLIGASQVSMSMTES